MYQSIPTKCLTGEVRLSYVHLSQPYTNPNQPQADPKYTATLLIPKSDTATIADLQAAFNSAAEAGVTSKWGGVRPPVISPVIHDGDGVRTDGMPYGPECKGHWVLTASTKQKPQVVGIDNVNCELAPQDIYSGMYARVTVNFFPFNTAGKKGVGCGLGNVLKTREGEPLGGGASAQADFAGIAADPSQGAVPGYAPPAPAPAAAPVPGQVGGATQAPGTRINPITGQPM